MTTFGRGRLCRDTDAAAIAGTEASRRWQLRSGRHAAGDAFGKALHLLDGAEHLIDLRHQQQAFRGRVQPPADAAEQRHADAALDLLQRLRHRRLRDVEDAGGRGDAAGLHHGAEYRKMPDVDHRRRRAGSARRCPAEPRRPHRSLRAQEMPLSCIAVPSPPRSVDARPPSESRCRKSITFWKFASDAKILSADPLAHKLCAATARHAGLGHGGDGASRQ